MPGARCLPHWSFATDRRLEPRREAATRRPGHPPDGVDGRGDTGLLRGYRRQRPDRPCSEERSRPDRAHATCRDAPDVIQGVAAGLRDPRAPAHLPGRGAGTTDGGRGGAHRPHMNQGIPKASADTPTSRASMKLQSIITNVQAGVLSAILEVLGVIAFAALIFSGPLAAHLATGIVLLLISTTVIGLVGTLGSSYPGMLASLRTPMIPVLAAMVAATAATMTAEGRESDLLGTTIATLGITSIVTGLALGLLGRFGLGRLVRYFPYPVMAGFFAGTGAYLFTGGLSIAADQPVAWEHLSAWFSSETLPQWGSALGCGAAFYVIQRRWDHWLVAPLFLLLGLATFHGLVVVERPDPGRSHRLGLAAAAFRFPGLTAELRLRSPALRALADRRGAGGQHRGDCGVVRRPAPAGRCRDRDRRQSGDRVESRAEGGRGRERGLRPGRRLSRGSEPDGYGLCLQSGRRPPFDGIRSCRLLRARRSRRGRSRRHVSDVPPGRLPRLSGNRFSAEMGVGDQTRAAVDGLSRGAADSAGLPMEGHSPGNTLRGGDVGGPVRDHLQPALQHQERAHGAGSRQPHRACSGDSGDSRPRRRPHSHPEAARRHLLRDGRRPDERHTRKARTGRRAGPGVPGPGSPACRPGRCVGGQELFETGPDYGEPWGFGGGHGSSRKDATAVGRHRVLRATGGRRPCPPPSVLAAQ